MATASSAGASTLPLTEEGGDGRQRRQAVHGQPLAIGVAPRLVNSL